MTMNCPKLPKPIKLISCNILLCCVAHHIGSEYDGFSAVLSIGENRNGFVLDTEFAGAIKEYADDSRFTWGNGCFGPFGYGASAGDQYIGNDQRRFAGVFELVFVADLGALWYIVEIKGTCLKLHDRYIHSVPRCSSSLGEGCQ